MPSFFPIDRTHVDKAGPVVTSVAIFILPALARAAVQSEPVTFTQLLLCHVPLVLALAARQAPRLAPTATAEHVLRHLAYAASLSSGALCLRWDVLLARAGAVAWASNYLLVWLLANLSLWYFAFAHVAQNSGATWLRVHHGDVTVLPMGLAVVLALYTSLPPGADAIFVFMRSAPFFIVLNVAWSTIHLLSFAGFAHGTTSALEHEHYEVATTLGHFIAMPMSCLLEMEAPLPYFAVYALVAALVAQCTDLRKARYTFQSADVVLAVPWAGLFVLVCALSTGFDSRVAAAQYGVLTATALSLSTVAGRCVIGRQFHLPMTAVLTLLLTCLTEQTGRYADSIDFGGVVAVRLVLHGSYQMAHFVLTARAPAAA